MRTFAFLALSTLGLGAAFQIPRSPFPPSARYADRVQVSHDFSLRSIADGGDDGPKGKVSIVYCTGCRWMLRAAYFAQELLTTFQDDLTSVTLVPSRPPSPGGIFLVTVDGKPIWNRADEGRFPETKELKQKIRDIVSPDRDLGHSDAREGEGDQEATAGSTTATGSDEEAGALIFAEGKDIGELIPPHVSISYCTGCKWMLRAAWFAQELLTTFQEDLNSVSLVPSRDVTGTFTVTLDNKVIWDRKSEGRHAEAKELKQQIRDEISPERDLGHSDVKSHEPDDASVVEGLSDNDAEEQRRFFGVS